jgi:hypothetical protein
MIGKRLTGSQKNMATKKSQSTKNKEIVIASEPMPGTILKSQDPARYASIALPKELRGKVPEDIFEKEAPTGFSPVMQFGPDPEHWQTGVYHIARFLGVKYNVGPNKSNMYEFELPDEKNMMQVVSLWGSTILDNKMAALGDALRPGKYLFIQFLGETPTARGLNPAKDFRVAILKDSVVGKL